MRSRFFGAIITLQNTKMKGGRHAKSFGMPTAMKNTKTNAARILDRLGISYEIHTYDVDLNDLGAIHAAQAVGCDVKMVFKTLVARGDKTGIIMACIPGDASLDLKKLAAISGNKKAEMIHMKDLFALTGYVRGGCSPLGAKKNYPVFIDESALSLPQISISAGKRGEQLWVNPNDLIAAVKAKTAALTK